MKTSSENQPGHSFDLASGHCHLLPQYLVITPDGDVKKVLRKKERNTYQNYSALVMMLFGAMALLGFYAIVRGKTGEAVLLFTGAALCIYFFLSWRGKSNTKLIHRKKIRNIQLKRIRSNPTFVVSFQDPQGKLKKRQLMMKAEDLQQIDCALKIFRSQNLMSARSVNQQSSYQPDFEKELKQTYQALAQGYSTPKKEEKPKTKTSYKRDAGGYLKEY